MLMHEVIDILEEIEHLKKVLSSNPDNEKSMSYKAREIKETKLKYLYNLDTNG